MEISEQKLIEVDSLNTDDVSVAFELIIEQLTIVEEELKKKV